MSKIIEDLLKNNVEGYDKSDSGTKKKILDKIQGDPRALNFFLNSSVPGFSTENKETQNQIIQRVRNIARSQVKSQMQADIQERTTQMVRGDTAGGYLGEPDIQENWRHIAPFVNVAAHLTQGVTNLGAEPLKLGGRAMEYMGIPGGESIRKTGEDIQEEVQRIAPTPSMSITETYQEQGLPEALRTAAFGAESALSGLIPTVMAGQGISKVTGLSPRMGQFAAWTPTMTEGQIERQKQEGVPENFPSALVWGSIQNVLMSGRIGDMIKGVSPAVAEKMKQEALRTGTLGKLAYFLNDTFWEAVKTGVTLAAVEAAGQQGIKGLIKREQFPVGPEGDKMFETAREWNIPALKESFLQGTALGLTGALDRAQSRFGIRPPPISPYQETSPSAVEPISEIKPPAPPIIPEEIEQGVPQVPAVIKTAPPLQASVPSVQSIPRELLPVTETITPVVTPRQIVDNIVNSVKEKVNYVLGMQPGTGMYDPRRPTVPPDLSIVEPGKRSEFTANVTKDFNLPIRQGTLQSNLNILGWYDRLTKLIRVGSIKNIEVVSHELGHNLYEIFGFSKSQLSPFASELGPIASKGRPWEEGYSEFIRYYLTDKKKAALYAPAFLAHFETLVKTEPGLKPKLDKLSTIADKYFNQSARQRIRSNVSVSEDQKEGWFPKSFDDFKMQWIDDLQYLQSETEAMAKIGGMTEVPLDMNMYKLGRLLKGWSGTAQNFIENKPIRYGDKMPIQSASSLKEILEPVKNEIPNLTDYLLAKRVIEIQKNFPVEKKGMTGIELKDAEEVVRQDKHKFESTAIKLYEYQDHVLNYFKDAGMISESEYKMIRKMNQAYVPFFRIMGDAGEMPGQTRLLSSAIEIRGSPLKRRGGSERDIVDPIESIFKNTFALIHAAERNAVGQGLVKLAKYLTTQKRQDFRAGKLVTRLGERGIASFIEKVPLPKQRIKALYSEYEKKLPLSAQQALKKWAALDPKNNLDDLVTLFRPSVVLPEENMIVIRDKGVKQLYRVSPEIASAMKNLNKQEINILSKIFTVPTQILRVGATANPEFMLRNIARDQLSMAMFSKYGWYLPFLNGDFVKGLYASAYKTPLYYKWLAHGGANSEFVRMDRSYMQDTIAQIIRKQPNAQGWLKNVASSGADLLNKGLNILKRGAEISEQATRIAEFSRGLRAEKQTTEGVKEASFASRELIDFAKMGAKGRAINQAVAFWAAGVNGFDKVVREAYNKPGQFAVRFGTFVALPTIYFAWAGKDDPRIEWQPQWKKDLFWLFTMPWNRITRQEWDGLTQEEKTLRSQDSVISIRKGDGPIRMATNYLEQAVKEGEAMSPGIWDRLLTSGEQEIPGYFPTAFTVPVEWATNINLFRKSPIVSSAQRNLEPQDQYGPRTGMIPRALGRLPMALGFETGISPAKISNAIIGATGNLGRGLMELPDTALSFWEEGISAISKRPWADIPGIRAFFASSPMPQSKPVIDFYDNLDAATKKFNSKKLPFKQKDPRVKFENILSPFNKAAEQIAELSKESLRVETDYTLTPSQRREVQNSLYIEMAELAEEYNKEFPDIIEGIKQIE